MIAPKNTDYKIIEVDTSNRCNLRCPTCNRQDTNFKPLLKEKYFMDASHFDLMLQKFPNVERFFLGLMFDEPTLNPYIFDIITFLKQNGKAITLNTNGSNSKFGWYEWMKIASLLDKEDRIVWSMDGLTKETYLKHRVGGNFQLLKDSITTMSGQNHTNIIQIIKFEHNKEEIEKEFPKFQRIHDIIWNKPVWDIIESNGQCTIQTKKVKPTWSEDARTQVRNHLTLSGIQHRCLDKSEGEPTLFISHTGLIGLCLPHLVSLTKIQEAKEGITLSNRIDGRAYPFASNITNSIESINKYLDAFYASANVNYICQFYCGKNAIEAKTNANLDYKIT